MDMLEAESPRARLALLLQHFSALEDDRELWRIVADCLSDRGGSATGDLRDHRLMRRFRRHRRIGRTSP